MPTLPSRRSVAAILWLGLSCIPRLAVAAPDEEPAEVVVRGDPLPRSASETTRKRDVLEAAPHRTASDLLLTVPGVFVTQHSGEGKAHQIFFRGFDAAHGQDIEFDVAGVPVNEVSNIHAQGYSDLHFVMPEVVSRIEALPGPYDAAQGDFAIAGTLRYRLGYPEPGVTVTGEYGSFDTRRIFVAYQPDGAPEETFAAFEAYRTDGFGEGRSADRASALGQALLPLGDGVSLRTMASLHAGRFGSAGVLRLDEVDRGRIGRFDSYDTNQGGDSARVQVISEVVREADTERVSFAPFAVIRQLRLRSNFTGYLRNPAEGDTLEQRNDSTTAGFRASYGREVALLSGHDRVEAGLFARHDRIAQEQDQLASADSRVLARSVDAAIRATNVAGHGSVVVHPVRRVRVQVGLRVDGLSYAVDNRSSSRGTRTAQGTHVGEKAVVAVTIAPGAMAVASYGAGFRSPQARGLGDGERTPFTTVHSGEVGVRFRERRVLEAGLAGYYTRLSDDIVFDETVARNEAAPGTERLGGVAFMTATPRPWFTSALSSTVTRATFIDDGGRYRRGDLLPFVPQVVLRSDLSVRPRLGELEGEAIAGRFGLGLTYLVRRPLPYGEIGRDVFVADALAALRWSGLETRVEVFNVLGAAWYDGQFSYASSFDREATPSLVPATHVTAGAPRTVLFSLSLTI